MHLALTDRVAALCGAAGAALVFGGLTTANGATESISNDDPAESIAYALDAGRDEVRLGLTLALAGSFLVIWFLGWLHGRVRAAEGHGWLSAVVLGGGTIGVAGILGYAGVLVAATNSEIVTAPETARTLLIVTWELGGVLAPAFGALVGATSVACLRYQLLPRLAAPVAWAGIPLALGLGLSGFLGGFLVVVAVAWLFGLALCLLVFPVPARELRPLLGTTSR